MSSQCSSITWRARSSRPAEDRRDDPGVLGVGVGDVGLEHRDRAEHLVHRRLHRGDRLDQPVRAGERGDRQVEARVGLAVHGRSGGRGDGLVGRLEPLALLLAEAARWRPGGPRPARRSGGTRGRPPTRRAVVAVRRDAARADGVDGRIVTTVPPPRPRVVCTSPASRSAAIASRRVARDTARRLGQLALGGRAPSRAGRRPDGSAWPAAPRTPRRRDGPEPDAARPRAARGRGRRSPGQCSSHRRRRCQWSGLKPFRAWTMDAAEMPGLPCSKRARESFPGG